MQFRNPAKLAKITTITTLCVLIGWGAVMVLATVRPFWIDEWRLIYNLKCKDASALWGQLDYTQQFPRVYLHLLKLVTAYFNYSYFILRLPSLLVSIASMLLCYSLMKRLYPERKALSYLFVLILVSSQTFTEYIVQMKHYEMEIFLSLVAIWQLLELLRLPVAGVRSWPRYLLLCGSLLAAPFFSYTYPIAILPVFIVVFVQGQQLLSSGGKAKTLVLQWLPLLLCICCIGVFYIIDVAQLMHDENMHRYWEYKMRGEGFNVLAMLTKFWYLFAEVGAGALFEIIFGLLGICAFGFGIYKFAKGKGSRSDTDALVRFYCIVLLGVVIALFLAGKLPVGEPKFNAFTVPAIAILIVYLLGTPASSAALGKAAVTISVILFLGLSGNIVSTIIRTFTLPEYPRRMVVYRETETAIRLAQQQHLPMIVTPGIAYPDDIVKVTPFLSNVPPAAILKTFPAYEVGQHIAVYSITDQASIDSYLHTLPPDVTAAVAGDGLRFRIVRR